MQRTEFLIPKEGLKVLDPTTFIALPPEGQEKAIDSYWLRRIEDGDVRVRTQPATTKPAAKSADKE